MTNQQKSYIYALGSIFAWSTVSTAFKLALLELSPLGLLLISSLVATAFLAIAIWYDKGASCSKFFPNLAKSALAGFLNPFLYYVILFTAYSRLRAQEAQSLNYTWAIVLSVFMVIFMRQKFRIKDFVALLVSFVGVLVISTQGRLLSLKFDDPLGTSLALSSSLVWALYWIVNLRDNRPNLQKLFYNFLVGSLFIAAYLIISSTDLFLPAANISVGVLWGIWIGIFEMGLTFLLWLKALQLTENAAKISNLIFLTPFISMLFIAGILHESIHPATILGLILIVFSNMLQKLKQ
jgi:drug/metabolite transporter (DMT)-like permease